MVKNKYLINLIIISVLFSMLDQGDAGRRRGMIRKMLRNKNQQKLDANGFNRSKRQK